MKVKRHRHLKKTLAFYESAFGIVPPFTVLIDGTFCRAALNDKINIREQLCSYLGSDIELSTTCCVKNECRLLGSTLFGPLKVLKQFSLLECGHAKHAVSADRCLRRVIRQRNPLCFVATQDPELTEFVRHHAGVPLVFISHKAVVLESPSDASLGAQKQQVDMRISKAVESIDRVKSSLLPDEVPSKRRRKRTLGPNPMSCKRGKRKRGHGTKAARKRKRHKRIYIAPHVREELLRQLSAATSCP